MIRWRQGWEGTQLGVGVWTLICELICIPLGNFIDTVTSAIALFHSHHYIDAIHFYEIWPELQMQFGVLDYAWSSSYT